jgi:hypothetical protein
MNDVLAEPRWLRHCADPRIFAAACAWLFVLTILGTVVQGEIGLFQAQERYFSSWLLWLGPVPLPGGRLTLSVTGMNLLSVLFTRRGTRNLGLALLHAGMLLLLGGALVGGALRQEGSMALFEGETSDEMRSWHHHELALLVAGEREDRLITVGEGLLVAGATITHPELPMPLVVERYLANARLRPDGTMEALSLELEAERNQPGVSLRLPDGRLLATCEGSGPLEIRPGLRAGIRRIGTRLPVGIELVKFQRENHPGTGMARRFSSEVMVHEDGGSRRVVISMNRPLRIGSWTLYQQSYSETAEGTQSVLAVVHDRFQLSPYIASAVMLIGLLLHLLLRLRRREAA